MPHVASRSSQLSGWHSGTAQTLGPPAPQTSPGPQPPQPTVPSQPSLMTPRSNCAGQLLIGVQLEGRVEQVDTPLQASEAVPQVTPAQAVCWDTGVHAGHAQLSTWPQP